MRLFVGPLLTSSIEDMLAGDVSLGHRHLDQMFKRALGKLVLGVPDIEDRGTPSAHLGWGSQAVPVVHGAGVAAAGCANHPRRCMPMGEAMCERRKVLLLLHVSHWPLDEH